MCICGIRQHFCPRESLTGPCLFDSLSKISKWMSSINSLNTLQTAAFVLVPGQVSLHAGPLKVGCQFPTAFWVICTIAQLFFKAHLSIAGPRVGCLLWAWTPHSSGRNSCFVRSLWIVDSQFRGGGFSETVSMLLLLSGYGPFVLCCGIAVQLVSRSFPEWIVSHVLITVDLLCSQ